MATETPTSQQRSLAPCIPVEHARALLAAGGKVFASGALGVLSRWS